MIYLEYIKNAFKSQLEYRLNWVMNIFGSVLSIFLQICLWDALTTGHEDLVTMEYMLGYLLISTMIHSIIITNTIEIINKQISSGQIAMDLIKPVNFRAYMFCKSLGDGLFRFLFQYLPVTIVMTIIYKCYQIWLAVDIFFIISVFLGMYLYFSIAYCLALTSFWYTKTWILKRFLNDFISLFSGKMIPVWMFPAFMIAANRFFPFQYIYYTPISILLNGPSVAEKVTWIGIQVVWCMIFTILGYFLERKGRHKLQVQGG